MLLDMERLIKANRTLLNSNIYPHEEIKKRIERKQAANLAVQKEQEEQAAQISEDILKSDSDCDLPSCDDFFSIDVPRDVSVTFSNPIFDSNDDFTSIDDDSLSDEDIPEDVKIYSNPLFEFDDEYISSDVNPLFDEVLEDIECKDSYDSNLDESTFLHCFILEGFTDEPPLEENDDLFDLESKENDWKKILYDAPIDDLITGDKDCPDFEGSRTDISRKGQKQSKKDKIRAREWKEHGKPKPKANLSKIQSH
ncbi:hypothetical protein Tco_0953365 [Tanacetum coccineum]|uniref:Uncharacterized protein n=1 Tax=Tanacetum coccineum TaxID=301880 RepID=A0ABQ5DZU4_9ASTR